MHPEINWQLQFATFAKVVNWKKHPYDFHWLRLFRFSNVGSFITNLTYLPLLNLNNLFVSEIWMLFPIRNFQKLEKVANWKIPCNWVSWHGWGRQGIKHVCSSHSNWLVVVQSNFTLLRRQFSSRQQQWLVNKDLVSKLSVSTALKEIKREIWDEWIS